MPKLKDKINKNIILITLAMSVAVLVIFFELQRSGERRRVFEEAEITFGQIEVILEENGAELEKLEAEYKDKCLTTADQVAYMLAYNRWIISDTEALVELAALSGVDEINVFDRAGKIYAGTNPEYFGMTMDSGEQIGFFKPMLEDTSLRLYQEITPNTYIDKQMQYTAVWTQDGQDIVQIGRTDYNVLSSREKNQLSYIFSLLNGGAMVDLYAVDLESGIIVGSTNGSWLDDPIDDYIDLSVSQLKTIGSVTRFKMADKSYYCVFRVIGEDLMIYAAESKPIIKNIAQDTAMLAAAQLAVSTLLIVCVTWFIDKHLVKNIKSVNATLTEITEGDLGKSVNINDTEEFDELSRHINSMIKSVLSSTEKISYIIDKTNLHIGVYEYGDGVKYVRCTETVPEILGMSREELKKLTEDYRKFREHLNLIRRNPAYGAEDIYMLPGEKEKYVKLDEVSHGKGVIGIVMDATKEVEARRRIESERDKDVLTGLMNRRGMLELLNKLFEEPKGLGCGAAIMIDTDDLKFVNDTYGHPAGDAYIIKMAELVSGLGRYSGAASRLGGDEFAVLIYGYPNDAEVMEDIAGFRETQDSIMIEYSDSVSFPLRYSFGYALISEEHDHHKLMRKADIEMYNDKRERKTKKE